MAPIIRKLILLLFVFISLTGILTAQELAILIPLNPIGVPEPGAEEATVLLHQALTDLGVFRVISRTAVNDYLTKEIGSPYDCTTPSCILETARWLSARYIFSGELRPFENGFSITLSLSDARTGRLYKRIDADSSSLDAAAGNAAALVTGLYTVESESPTIAGSNTSIFIETTPPGAAISINGVPRGASPDQFSRIPSGAVFIEAETDTRYAAQTVRTATTGGRMSITLSDLPALVSIVNEHPEAETRIDGFPVTGQLVPGYHHVVSRYPGGRFDSLIYFAPGATTVIDIDYEPYGSLRFVLADGTKAILTAPDYRTVLFDAGILDLPAGTYDLLYTGLRMEDSKAGITIGAGETVSLRPVLQPGASASLNDLSGKIAEMERKIEYGYRLTTADMESLQELVNRAAAISGQNPGTSETAKNLLERAERVRRKRDTLERIAELESRKNILDEFSSDTALAREGRRKLSTWSLVTGLASAALSGITYVLGDWAYGEYLEAPFEIKPAWKNRVLLMDTLTYTFWGTAALGTGGFAVLRLTERGTDPYRRELDALDTELLTLRNSLED